MIDFSKIFKSFSEDKIAKSGSYESYYHNKPTLIIKGVK